jgi:hypothetical protein
MSEPENFIARWSRRKRDAADDADAAKLPATRGTADEGAQDSTQESKQESKQESGHAAADDRAKQDATAAQTTAPELAFDVTSLPPIDSIDAETDIRAFLAPGVPADLTRAALRRAWAADPKVRDFVGLADYDWDFNTPGAIPGFGPLEMTDELRRQVAQMVGRSLTVEDAADPTATAEGGQAPVEIPNESGAATSGPPTQTAQSNCGTSQDEPQNSQAGPPDVLRCGEDHAATQYGSTRPDDVQSIVRRPRGGALPK